MIHEIVADDFTFEERVDLIDRASRILGHTDEGDVFGTVENARLSEAYCALRHGLKEVARRETLALAERPYFQRNRRYEWMIRDVMRGCGAGQAPRRTGREMGDSRMNAAAGDPSRPAGAGT